MHTMIKYTAGDQLISKINISSINITNDKYSDQGQSII